jgi:hypothetical protein
LGITDTEGINQARYRTGRKEARIKKEIEQERIQVRKRSGDYIEWNKTGRIQTKNIAGEDTEENKTESIQVMNREGRIQKGIKHAGSAVKEQSRTRYRTGTKQDRIQDRNIPEEDHIGQE